MLNKKLAGLFLIPAVLTSVNASHAISTSASQTIEAVLESFVDIQALTSGAVTSAKINAENGNLDTGLTSKFQIRSNSDTPELYLKATTESSTNPVENAFFENGGDVYVILSNTGRRPLTSAVTNCKDPSPTSVNNADAIAYPISNVALTNSGTANYDSSKNQYKITAKTGETIATTTIGTTPLANTYSFEDTAGTYQAILTLSTTSL